MFVFDLTNRESFERIITHWAGENKHSLEKSILVGNKADLSSANPRTRMVSIAEARELTDRLGLATYLEVSAKDQTSVNKLAKAIARGGPKISDSSSGVFR